MRVRNCCLALALSSAAGPGPSLVSAAKQAKVKANTGTNSVNVAPSSPASFVLADKVAALSPSEKHRLEQLLLISGRYDLSLNVNIEDAIEAVEGSDSASNNNHGRRRKIKAEQSDAELYIGNNADGNGDDDDEDSEAVNPEDVTGDPRELPLPSGNNGNGSNNNNNNNGDSSSSTTVNGNGDGNTSGNTNNNGNGFDDGRGTDNSDDWQMNGHTNTNTNSDNTDAAAAGAGGSDGSDGDIDNNADAETDGSGSVSDSDPASSSSSSSSPRCQLDDSTGLFGSDSDPESASGLAKSTIVRYQYEVEFDLSKVERLMKALPKMEAALAEALVPAMFQECAEEEANNSNGSKLDGGWVKPPPGVEVSDERERGRNEDGRGLRTNAMKIIRRAKEIDGVVGFSSAPEDRVVGGEACSVLNPPTDNGCIKVEGQLTLYLAQDANDRRAVKDTQDVIETTMASGDLADVDRSIITVEYVADGLFEPATTKVPLSSEGENGTQGGGGSFPYAIAGGAAAALVGVALIGVGVKKARNKDSEDDDDSEDMNGIDEMSSSIPPGELNSSDEDDLGKEAAYDMSKMVSPQNSQLSFDTTLQTTEVSDPSTAMSSPNPDNSALISTSAGLGPIIEMTPNDQLINADGKLGIEPAYNDEAEFVGVGIAQQLDDCDNHSTLFGAGNGSVAGQSGQSATGSLASVDGRGSILNDICGNDFV